MGAFDFKKHLEKATHTVKENLETLQDAVSDIDLSDSMQAVKEKSGNAIELLSRKAGETVTAISEAVQKVEIMNGCLTTKGALTLFYLLMAADHQIEESEILQFCEIGRELDTQFEVYQEELLLELKNLTKEFDEDEYFEDIRDCVKDTIEGSFNVRGATIPAKLFLWDLQVISFSDNNRTEEEDDLIRYIAKHLKVDKSVVSEMEETVRTLIAMEQEKDWLKSTNRPYEAVEAELNGLSNRSNAILQGVHMLINE